MTRNADLVYMFWHWPRPDMDRGEYESRQRAFHASLAASSPEGFSHSTSSALSGAPWANDGQDAYQDRYFLRGSASLDALDAAAVSGRRQQAHDAAAASAAGGTAGLYQVRLGEPLPAPRHAVWFSKADGMTYAELFALLTPRVLRGEGALLQRRMVLGPTAEFCVESSAHFGLPATFPQRALRLRPAWPEQVDPLA
jgi:hypothetical protein